MARPEPEGEGSRQCHRGEDPEEQGGAGEAPGCGLRASLANLGPPPECPRRHHVIGEDGTTIPGDLAERLGLEPRAAWSPEAARKEANRVRGLALDGKDPDAGREVPTLRDFAIRYLAEHAEPFKKPRSVEEDRGLFDRHILKELGDYRLDQGTLTRFVQALKGKPTTANRCLALVSHVYTKAGEWGVVPAGTNPARGVPRFREAKRRGGSARAAPVWPAVPGSARDQMHTSHWVKAELG